MSEQTFEGVGGLEIFTRTWLPPEGEAKAIVVLVHGYNAHSGLYDGAARELARRNLAVYALDLRGHGKSGGERNFVEKLSDYIDDLVTFIGIAKADHPGLPTFLLGHSAGGVITASYALDHQKDITGLISESFAHEVPTPDFALAVLKGLSHIAPHVHVVKFHDEHFSRDPKVVEAMRNDPLIDHTPYPTNSFAVLARADERLKREFRTITLPVLIVHGTADKVTKPSGSQRFFDNTGSKDKTLKLYDGHAHDLLNDVGKEVVLADITEWITTRIPRGN